VGSVRCVSRHGLGASHHAELIYWGALAHARAGASHAAHTLIDRALGVTAEPGLATELRSLRGRLWKDRLHRARTPHEHERFARLARDEYLAAYSIASHPFPGINAASLSMLLGEASHARTLAAEVAGHIARRQHNDEWDLMTLGESALLLGDAARARDCYSQAAAAAPHDRGRMATARRQLRLLSKALPDARELYTSLRGCDVVAFTGHMIDAHDRPVPRFPARLEHDVAQAIVSRVHGWNAPVVYSSMANGGDLLFVEAALASAAEVNVVLPFKREEFVRTSVAPAGEHWIRRFDSALARANRVIYATHEDYLGDDSLFQYASVLVEGMTRLRAQQLETVPLMLAVLDSDASGAAGGTREAVERWNQTGGTATILDLASLRAATHQAKKPHSGRAASLGAAAQACAGRELKAMLFADVAGYSRLSDAMLPAFQRTLWNVAARELAACPEAPLLANTWGDALFAVFETPAQAARFALRLRDAVHNVDWSGQGFTDPMPLRTALHAGPVFRAADPILGRENFFGSGTTRAARIEPVTPPGLIYASEEFAASLAAAGTDALLEYVGTLQLAKRYGESRIYRLEQ